MMKGVQETDSTKRAFYIFGGGSFFVIEMNASALIVNVYFKLWMKKGTCWGKGKMYSAV